MKIDFIHYPYAFTNDGKRIDVREIEGHPHVGVVIEIVGDKYRVAGISDESDCVSGVCPIK
ncbi:MAG: hypothetical protein Q7J10_10400 [Methanosarcinaceae archaeon]|nr:hypothetical protein [Methanosarcinaceae archaeon]